MVCCFTPQGSLVLRLMLERREIGLNQDEADEYEIADLSARVSEFHKAKLAIVHRDEIRRDGSKKRRYFLDQLLIELPGYSSS